MEPKENVGKIFFQKLKKIKSRKIDFWARKFFFEARKIFFHGQKNFFRGRKNFFRGRKNFFRAKNRPKIGQKSAKKKCHFLKHDFSPIFFTKSSCKKTHPDYLSETAKIPLGFSPGFFLKMQFTQLLKFFRQFCAAQHI